MKIWCEVRFINEPEVIMLWVQIELLAIVPIGTSIEMPIPKDWPEYGDWIFGHVTGYNAGDGLLTCEVETDLEISIEDKMQELLDVGYRTEDDIPPEITELQMKSLR